MDEKKLYYCRKCTRILPEKEFYECTDNGLVDSNLKLSVCKNCINTLYDKFFDETNSMEKSLHKLCIILNVKYSNDAVAAVKKQIQTMMENGKKVVSIFGIYRSKLISINPSMDKSVSLDMTYEDVGTIFVSETPNTKEIPIPQEVIDFWGKDFSREDIEFLEREYSNFKKTHKADTYAEIVLLKNVCLTELDIKNARAAGNNTDKLITQLQNLMKNLAISPNVVNDAKNASKDSESFGLWIQDIEREEPAQWLEHDPRADIYRDVGNVEEYFQKYIVRPLKNFVMGSKDFNVDTESLDDDDFTIPEEDTINYTQINDEENPETL